jgi:hypothetical protein
MKPKESKHMRKRNYGLMLLVVLTAATIATSWVTKPATLLGSERTEQTIAGSAGSNAKITRESA